MKNSFSDWVNDVDSLDETVLYFNNPAKPEDIVGIGVSLDLSHDLIGLFLGVKQVVAPSICVAGMLKTYSQAYFMNIADRFEGLVTKMRIANPNYYVLPETDTDYREIQRELLNIRAEIKPKPYLDLHYDSKKGVWLYDTIISEIKLDNAYAYYE